jgi:hypothetical protein
MEVSSAVPRNAGGSTSEIVFAGERFDVMSVRRWRDRLLTGAPP